jgi:hypothetical protein
MRNALLKNFSLICSFWMLSLITTAQTVIFTETFGSPSATTPISTYTGWTNGVGLTFDQGGAANAADIRVTSASLGYSGASGGGNVFCTISSERGIGISGIQAASYTNLSLTFAYRKESGASLPTLQVDFWDGSAWVNVPFTFPQLATAATGWYLVSNLNLPSSAQINGLKIRFVKTGTTTSCRIDDVKLQGSIPAPTQLSIASIADPQTQNVTFNVTVTAVNASGTALPVTQNTTIGLTTNGNAGNLIGTTTSTIPAGSHSVIFSGLSLDGSGLSATINASVTSGDVLISATSNSFNVNSASAPDCAGVPGGSALPGTVCDDANACTINDVWSASCVCTGTVQDTDGDGTCDATDECDSDPNKILAGDCGCGNIEVGQSCNDNNACTENDVITSCGVCVGTALVDTDSDGTCDLTDECDNDPNKIIAGTCGCGNSEPTTACDDANALTSNDAINGACVCVGLYPNVYFDFAAATASVPAAHTTNTISNLVPGTLTRGNNNGTTNGIFNSTSASSGYAGASGTVNAGAAARTGALNLTAGSGSAYFEFSLDADQGYTLTITEITFGTRSTSTGPQAIALRSSADGYISDIATVSLVTGSWVKKSMLLSNFTTIPGSNVTYRLYGYNGTGSASTNTTNWRIDDLNIYGYTTFAPPSSIVQFSAPTQSGSETLFSDTLTITMDVAPPSDVVISVSDLLTGTATAGSDYNYTPSSVTFTSSESYPSYKYVGFAIINDTDVEPIETIVLGASITSGTATLGTSSITYSLSSDDLAQLVINEVDYDNVGTDNAEWIEIKNNGATAVDINGYKLELVNGGNTPATVYTTLTLASTSTLIQPGGYFVVGNNATIANINLVVTPTSNLIQNGAPDAIALKDNSNNLLDAVSYEGITAGVYTEGAAINTLIDGGSANFPSGTIGRYPDGADTGDNVVDFITLCSGTPGASNTPSTSTYYQDFDADTFGNADSMVAACEAPFGYVADNTDCNDTLSTAFPSGSEICGNGIDEDCSGADFLCPPGSFSTAIAVTNIGQFGTGVQATQVVNLSTGTNTVQSPGLGLDKWFTFTASANAMRIAIVGSSLVEDDNDLSLYETPTDATVQLIPTISENDVHPGDLGLATDGGSETLIFDQLIIGNVYYLCVRNNNNTSGNVNLTFSNLNASTTDIALYTNGTNTFTSACQNFKVKFRPNSAGYTINRWNSGDITGTPSWSYAIPVTSTVASTICQLGKVAPANLSGSMQTVYVTVDVLYNLKDAYGTITPATARATAASSFQMASEVDLNVRTTDRCAAVFKSTTSSIATNRSVCGTTRYVWEMSMVYPTSSLPLEVQGPVGGSRILMLNSVPALANGQRYDVRIASKHLDGATQTAYGTTQCVKTLGAAGMPTIEEEINVFKRSENGVTASIYPNPNNGQTVNFSINGLEGALQLKITDATGRQVYNNRFMVEGAMNTTLEFGQTLADGVYMVEMIQNGELKTMRMVVNR